MAITIKSSPSTYYSAQGDLLFVVYEATKAIDPVTYPNYKYVADIYVGATQVARIKKVPLPDNKMGVFNIGDIVRSYLSAVFNPTYLTLQAQQMGLSQFNIVVTVKFGEEYSFVIYPNVTVDSARTYFNHYNGRLIGVNTILTSYLDLPATTRPLTTPIRTDNVNNYIPYFPTSTTAVAVEFKAYDVNNSLTGTYTGSVTPSAANTLQVINTGVAMANSLSFNLINTATKYYTAKVGMVVYRFDLKCEPRYETFTLHFLNKLGGFETREFTKVSRKTIAITKTDFGKLPYTVDASGSVSYVNGNNVYNETKSVYASQYTEKLTLNTDILTDLEYQWLGELILSPMIYLEQFGYFLPCAITQSNYEFRKQVNDKLTNLTIDVNFGDQFNAQYR